MVLFISQHFEDFEKNAVSNFEEIEKNRIKDFEETGLDLRFSLFSLGQEDFSRGLDHWMALERIFRGDVITGWRRCEFFAETCAT